MKLLANPKRAPSSELQKFFAGLKAEWSGSFPTKITCRVETDRDKIDEILFRRHTGSQGGVGQANWDGRIKTTFVNRTGKGGGLTQGERSLTVVPATLTIGVGDMVMWNGGGNVPFAIAGEAEFFNSYQMVNECGFSHAFGLAGTYEWRDAFGSGLSGRVHVSDPDCKKDPDLKKWRAALGEGTVVMIADGKVDKRDIKIMTGQTVFFAIVKTDGISITDSRLIGQSWMHPDPCQSMAA